VAYLVKENPMSGMHEMFLQGPMEYGVGEWMCYDCGRRVLVRHAPSFEKVVLAPGNEVVNHASVIGDKRVITVAVKSDLYRTSLDEEWMVSHGMAWGNDGDQ
jgi:hypothetical protein